MGNMTGASTPEFVGIREICVMPFPGRRVRTWAQHIYVIS